MTNKVFDTALNTIEQHNMLRVSDHVIVGLSGGADSVALFHLLLEIRKQYRLTVTAVHVNHGIRGTEADEDEKFCACLCEKNNVAMELYQYDIKKIACDKGISEEEAGREMRYNAFFDAQKKLGAQKIAVAHNQNDQAETVFLRLFRGAGLKGLSGISPVRDDKIIRPLIDVSREEIELYCKENNFSYRNDSTNRLDCYGRNIVRNRVIPLVMENFNPSIVQTLAQTAKMVRLENDYLDLLAEQAYEKCVSDDGESLDIAVLSDFDDVIKRRVLRIAYFKLNHSIVDLAYNHVEKILSLLQMQSGKKVVIANGIVAKRQFDRLILNYDEIDKPEFSYELKIGSDIYIEETGLWITVSRVELKNETSRNNVYTKRFCYDKIKCGIRLRTRLPSDKINIANVGTKKIKDYLIDRKMDPSKRDLLYYLADGENIMWVVGECPEATGTRRAVLPKAKHMNEASKLYEADEYSEHNFYVQLWEDIK